MIRPCVVDVADVSFGFRTPSLFSASAQHQVIKDISLQIHAGETLGLVGRNGSGKSTLLRLMAGIYEPDSGAISRQAGSVALMTLDLGFDPALSGRDNALFGAMLLGFSKVEAIERLGTIQEFSGLGERFLSQVKTYSSGMVARLMFSVAVMLEADVLLIDEILAVGDLDFYGRARERLVARLGGAQTTVLVSHDLDTIEALCDSVAVLCGGSIIFHGTPAMAVAKYRETFA